MAAPLGDVRFAYQPLFNLHTGGIVAVEALARPTARTVHDVFRDAGRAGRLVETDISLAASAIRAAAEHETLLPLHVNLLAITAAGPPEVIDPVIDALRDTGRRARDIVLELGGPFGRVPRGGLIEGLAMLRRAGFRIALDGLGDADTPLSLLAETNPELLKVDRGVISGLPDEPGCTALLESLIRLAEGIGAQLAAVGVETDAQLATLRRLGVHLAQGNLLTQPSRRPLTTVSIPPAATELADPDATLPGRRNAGPRVSDFLHPATMLRADATSEEVRSVLANQPMVSSVVLVDEESRPRWTLDRNRFLLAVTGPYGHALHAKRDAARLADRPHLVRTDTTALELLDTLAGVERNRINDDVVVVDEAFHCLGVVRVTDVVRGIAEMKVEEAAALNPLTRLPGSDQVGQEIERRIAAGEIFAVGWLDIDGFKTVNDSAGFAAGDDLIRTIGRGLTDAAATLSSVRVGHVGGDDFLFVTGLDDLVPLANALLDTPRSAGGLAVSLSLATLVCASGSVTGYREVSRLLAPLKQHAKALRGSSWVLGRPGSDRVDVLRGTRGPDVPPRQPARRNAAVEHR
ncbi:GGDEF domain-containing protein [Gandjariella thermophila]|uniref:GGDEF domain-containing protein n=1 Tax=Gandjariella thermophila TaxID=1931992 RepID=A0A4D4IX63_9PSEU|nr:GGDEF domain-containing protein [Gandjariella thermophila]GDY28945.1 GGDEF domain-containing protein [Gandjariella thermophila]